MNNRIGPVVNQPDSYTDETKNVYFCGLFRLLRGSVSPAVHHLLLKCSSMAEDSLLCVMAGVMINVK